MVVNCFNHKHNHKGKIYEMQIRDYKELYKIAKNFQHYVEVKDEKQQSLVDALIISNLNMSNKEATITSFDFNLNST